MHHADDAVLVEAMLYGTHQGSFRGLPPTGRSFEMQFLAVFVFEHALFVCERVYFDSATVLRQLGIAHDPLTLRGRLATPPTTRSRSGARWCVRRSVAERYLRRRERRRSFSTRPPVCSWGQ
jgi:SnoaL-like polyketide cyclase